MSLQDKENKRFPKDFDGIVTSAYSSTADIVIPARESLLQEADRIVNGDRQADYSDPVENFKHKRDNLVDLAGYTEILHRIKETGHETR